MILPGAAHSAPAADPSRDSAGVQVTSSPARVLIVDNLADDQEIYGIGLRSLGFDVLVRATLADAIPDAATFTPDVIVLHLGDAEWELCDRLHDHAATRDVPVIVITGWVRPDRANRERARTTANCAAFVGKPCTHKAVAAVIARVLAGERQIELSHGEDA